MRYFSLISLLLLSNNNSAMHMHKKYLLPSAEVLRKRLLTIPECHHFVENSNIIQTLANQEKFPVVVFVAIGFEFDMYAQRFKNKSDHGSICSIETIRPQIVKSILQDHPSAVTMLEQQGILVDPVK